MKDWNALTGELADWLTERHSAESTARGLGWRGDELAELARRASDVAEFAESLGGDSTVRATEARYDWTVLDRTEGVPWPVLKALNECQKPFHLWNVERTEMEHPFELRAEPKFTVGSAATGGAKGMPGQIETSTHALAKWISDRAFEDLVERGNRQRFKQLLRDPLPFGKADAGGPVPGKTVSWNPMLGGPPPSGQRPPGTGGPSFGRPPSPSGQ